MIRIRHPECKDEVARAIARPEQPRDIVFAPRRKRYLAAVQCDFGSSTQRKTEMSDHQPIAVGGIQLHRFLFFRTECRSVGWVVSKGLEGNTDLLTWSGADVEH